MIKIIKSWFSLLQDEFAKDYFKSLQSFLKDEYSNRTIFPQEENIFNALNYVPFDKVKVVIIGQDPYHEPGQAQGLSFSVPQNFPYPPSLVNIFKEIEDDLQIKCLPSGKIIQLLGKKKEPVVFMLWGSHAQKFEPLIEKQHLVLKASHPSPLSAYRGFFGCKHFSKCNEFLQKNGQTPIDWS